MTKVSIQDVPPPCNSVTWRLINLNFSGNATFDIHFISQKSLECDYLLVHSATIAHLLSEVDSEIFRNQIYFSFYPKYLNPRRKIRKGKNTIMRSAI